MKARLATRIGKVVLGAYEDEKTIGHRHSAAIGEVSWDEVFDGGMYVCDICGQEFNPDTGGGRYDTPSGQLEEGCLYWDDSLPETAYWDNHKGPHLMAVCPGGGRWNIDSRASNCRRRDDRTTRCWKREGTPPNIHTMECGCGAGAGSVFINQGGGPPTEWHGYLHHGEFHT